MTREVTTVTPDETVGAAASKMWKARVHRVVVVDEAGHPAGIFSTQDVMKAVRDKRLNHPLSGYMHAPVFTVRTTEPISLAAERLERAGVSGLAVVDEGWPVGVFTSEEALAWREQPRDTPVEEAMSAALLVLDEGVRMHRAAAQALEMNVRRILVTRGGTLAGILSGLDFARAAAS